MQASHYPVCPPCHVALIQDVATSAESRSSALRYWQDTGLLPPSFQVLDRGGVPSHQTVGRAELCAAIQAVRYATLVGCPNISIYTDSAYVVHVFEQFRGGNPLAFLRTAVNTDLLGLLGDVWFPGVAVVKVKSHLDPTRVTDAALRWRTLGNQCADEACDAARQAELGVILDMSSEAATYHIRQQSQLRQVHEYFLALNLATVQKRNGAALDHSCPLEQPTQVRTMERPAVQHWIMVRMQPSSCHYLPAVSSDIFRYSTWGLQYSWRVWSWAHTLEWVSEEDDTVKGVSTLELLCNYVAVTSSLPPHPVTNNKGEVEYMDFTTQEAKLACTPIRTWLQSLLAVVRQLERLSAYRLFPPEASSKVSSLLALGEIHPRSGVRCRVRFTKVIDTAHLLLAVLNRPGTAELRRHVCNHASETLCLPPFLQGLGELTPAEKKRRRLSKRRQ